MFEEITYYLIFGRPVIFYLGLLTLTSFLLTISIAILNKIGVHKIAFKWHLRFAYLSIFLALIHGGLAILAYL